MTATIDIPDAEPTIERPEGQPAQLDDLAAGLHRASLTFEEVADEAAQLRDLRSFSGAAYEAYRSASGTASDEHSRLRSTIQRVGHAVDAHAEALREHLRRHDDLVERRSTLDRQRDALVADVDAATEVTPAEIAELRRRAEELRGRYADLRRDHDALHRRVDADERLLAQAFRAADTTEESLSDDGGTTVAARNAMARAGAPGDGASPEQVNAWWKGLSPEEQHAVVMAYPGVLGSAAGLPASARDDANRLLLDEDVAELRMKEAEGTLSALEQRMLANAEDTRTALADADSYTDPIDGHRPGGTLWMYDPAAWDGEGRVAVGVGDLDTADDVAVFTPGITTDQQSVVGYTDKMMNLYESTRYGGDGSGSAATMFWLGYDAPDEIYSPATLSEGRADAGGEALADDVDALRASRADDPAHMTAIGHSYGSTTTAYAGADHGLDVDSMALVGSPGAGPAGDADDLGADDVFVGRDSRDNVADLGDQGLVSPTDLAGPMAGLGDDPSSDDFGAVRFEAENVDRSEDSTWSEDHSNYLENDSESLYNLGRIVDGDHDAVNEADHTYDPWNKTEQDPEWDRDPTRDEPGRSDTTRDRR